MPRVLSLILIAAVAAVCAVPHSREGGHTLAPFDRLSHRTGASAKGRAKTPVIEEDALSALMRAVEHGDISAEELLDMQLFEQSSSSTSHSGVGVRRTDVQLDGMLKIATASQLMSDFKRFHPVGTSDARTGTTYGNLLVYRGAAGAGTVAANDAFEVVGYYRPTTVPARAVLLKRAGIDSYYLSFTPMEPGGPVSAVGTSASVGASGVTLASGSNPVTSTIGAMGAGLWYLSEDLGDKDKLTTFEMLKQKITFFTNSALGPLTQFANKAANVAGGITAHSNLNEYVDSLLDTASHAQVGTPAGAVPHHTTTLRGQLQAIVDAGHHLTVAGMSLGAGLSSVTFAKILDYAANHAAHHPLAHNNFLLVTFGGMRCGNQAFQNLLQTATNLRAYANCEHVRLSPSWHFDPVPFWPNPTTNTYARVFGLRATCHSTCEVIETLRNVAAGAPAAVAARTAAEVEAIAVMEGANNAETSGRGGSSSVDGASLGWSAWNVLSSTVSTITRYTTAAAMYLAPQAVSDFVNTWVIDFRSDRPDSFFFGLAFLHKGARYAATMAPCLNTLPAGF